MRRRSAYAPGKLHQMRKPPTAGPTVPLIWKPLVRHLTAFSNKSRGTIIGSSAALAGHATRRNALSKKSIRYIQPTGAFAADKSARPTLVSVVPARPNSMIFRRSNRSASTPAGSVSRSIGSAVARPTRARLNGSFVR